MDLSTSLTLYAPQVWRGHHIHSLGTTFLTQRWGGVWYSWIHNVDL